MRRIWTLDRAWFLTPRSSVWKGVCLTVLSLDEAEWWNRLFSSTWHASGVPDSRSLTAWQLQSQSLAHWPGDLLWPPRRRYPAHSMGNSTRPRPQPVPLPGQCLSSNSQDTPSSRVFPSSQHPSQSRIQRVLGKQLPAQGWSKEGGCFQPEPEVSLR